MVSTSWPWSALRLLYCSNDHAVLAAERIELGAGDRILDRFPVGILRRHQHGGFDLVDLRFEFVEAGERGGDPVLGELVLALGEVAREFVGERVGDGDGVVLGLLGGGDLECAGLLVGRHDDLAGERSR